MDSAKPVCDSNILKQLNFTVLPILVSLTASLCYRQPQSRTCAQPHVPESISFAGFYFSLFMQVHDKSLHGKWNSSRKTASFVIYIFIHIFNSFTYRINPHYYQLWRKKSPLSPHSVSFYTTWGLGRLTGFVQASSTTNLRSFALGKSLTDDSFEK